MTVFEKVVVCWMTLKYGYYGLGWLGIVFEFPKCNLFYISDSENIFLVISGSGSVL